MDDASVFSPTCAAASEPPSSSSSSETGSHVYDHGGDSDTGIATSKIPSRGSSAPMQDIEDQDEIAASNGGGEKFRTMVLDQVTRSNSYINSLPSASALPEVKGSNSNVIEATDVIPVDVESAAPLVDATTTPQYQRASLISVRVFKMSRDTKLGIAFKSIPGGILQISEPPTDLLADSSLQAGDEVVSLNGIYCARWNSYQAADLLQGTIGFVSIVVKDPNGDPNEKEATVFKDHPQDRLGIVFQNDTDGRLRIENISPIGLLGSDCLLNTDDYVISINAIPCSEINWNLARSMVVASQGKVTIVANTINHETAISNGSFIMGVSSGRVANVTQTTATATATEVTTDEEWGNVMEETNPNPAFASVMLFKPSWQTKLGIRLINTDGILQVSSILSDGILTSSPLKEGFIMLSINNRQCKDWEASRALNVLEEAQGKLNIVTQNPNGNPNYVEAMVMKNATESKIGVAFQKTQAGTKLRLGNIDPNGMLAESVLNKGDYVMAINSVPCQYLQAHAATRLVRQAPKTVTILTKTQRSTGVVVSRISEPHGTELPAPLAIVLELERKKARDRRIGTCICSSSITVVFVLVFVVASGAFF